MLADKRIAARCQIFGISVSDTLADNATHLSLGVLALCSVYYDQLNANSFVKAMRRSVKTFKRN